MDIKFELKKCPFCGGEAQMIVAQADIKLYGIECKKCHILMGHTVNNSTEFFRKPIYAADAWNQRAETAAGQWVDVHDKLPEKGKNDFILCCFRNGYVDACTRGYLQENDNIVAWMPLPEPYKGAE